MATQKQIKEINKEVKDSLKEWSEILGMSNKDGWNCFLLFDSKDVFNSLNIFYSILSNYAINTGKIRSAEEAEEAGAKLRQSIIDTFKIDTVDLAEENL